MAGRIQRGLAMVKATCAVLTRHPRLLILPAISAAALVGALGMLLVGITIEAGSFRAAGELVKSLEKYFTDQWIVGIACLGLIGFGLTTISVFINSALVFCTLRCFAGEEPSIRAGFAVARGRLPQILGWALVATIVGGIVTIVQETLKDKLGFLGGLLGGLMDITWAAVTYFVLPVLVIENLGPIGAVKRSSAILRQTFGETVVGGTGLTAIGMLLALPAILVMVAGITLSVATGTGSIAMLLFVAGVLYCLVVSAIMGTLGTIFQTGLYVYATTGQAPLDEDLLKSAFQSKPQRSGKTFMGWFRR
jgi:Family of unknown function (DUF6159)